MSIIFVSEVEGSPSILLVKMVVITSMMVRLTARASPNKFLSKNMLVKVISNKRMVGRKVATELLTTYLPTILLLLITFVTIFFDKDLFGDAIAVNLTIMLVMTTIFTSKIEALPSTSDTKMIDIWLIGCLLVPFTEVVLRTMMEVLGNCDQCRVLEEKEGNSNKERKAAWKDAISMSGATSTGASGFMSETLVSFTF